MGKIVNIKEAIEQSSKLRKQRKTIVLVGGVFDILHIGHVEFLNKAKNKGDYLFLLLESDSSVRKLKGKGRPIHKQRDRAKLLSSLLMVDFVIPLTKILKNRKYDKLVKNLRPDFIAATKKDSGEEHKKRQAKLTGAKLIFVTDRIKNKSTSKIIKFLDD